MNNHVRKYFTLSKNPIDRAILIVMAVIIVTIMAIKVFADAGAETGDTRARPVSCYGTEADGSITAILVDSDGVVQTV